ncbi:MAG TPA: galactitol-1-phosphate 5-dehydrogenase [Roseiflexaceae bacterium]|jgi:L-iditol 2-dehydrogenase|nr:galactitol-1-phosphate 5-dehydrogenase [Roseiflexaceae bacterium]
MKALVYQGPWEMPVCDIEPPTPQPDEVIVKVQAVGVCGSDVHGYTGSTGRRFPGIAMGHEFCGTITAVGENVSDYHVGDAVIVDPMLTCGECIMCRAGRSNVCVNRTMIGMHQHGAYAEAVRAPQRQLHRKPDDLSWDHAALAEPLAVALHAVNQTPFQLGESVVIVGAGPIGLLALAAARLKGAGTVMITDQSPHRLELARQLGADVAINVARQDAIAAVKEATNGLGADAAIEAVGISPTVQQALAATRIGGNVTWIGNSAPEISLNMQSVVTREITIRGVYAFTQEFGQAINLLQSGRINVAPLIEHVGPLDQGPTLIHDLAKGTLDAVKVVLKP